MPRSGQMHFKLKWTSEDPSNAIILTFSGEWELPLRDGNISVVFRKTGPSGLVPRLMYPYVAQPASAIIGKMEILSYESMDIDAATRLCSEGSITEAKLREYAKDYGQLFVFHVGPFQNAATPITHRLLNDKYDYWPSSTFIPLSASGVATLDELGFRARK